MLKNTWNLKRCLQINQKGVAVCIHRNWPGVTYSTNLLTRTPWLYSSELLTRKAVGGSCWADWSCLASLLEFNSLLNRWWQMLPKGKTAAYIERWSVGGNGLRLWFIHMSKRGTSVWRTEVQFSVSLFMLQNLR